jgi:hypothetical protein
MLTQENKIKTERNHKKDRKEEKVFVVLWF